MKLVKSAVFECDWCEHMDSYDGQEAHEEASKDGWIVMDRYPETELTFCSPDCLISYL